jgi:hypothetical protein
LYSDCMVTMIVIGHGFNRGVLGMVRVGGHVICEPDLIVICIFLHLGQSIVEFCSGTSKDELSLRLLA